MQIDKIVMRWIDVLARLLLGWREDAGRGTG